MNERNATLIAPGVQSESTGKGEAPDAHTIRLPQANDKMFYGVFGLFAQEGAKGSEVPPVALAMACMSWLSAQMGRDVYLPIGDVCHPIVINTLHVGRPMLAAKSESVALLLRVESAIRDGFDRGSDSLLGQCRRGGISSLQEIALLVHDGYRVGKEDIPPIDDKRLWLYELPFAPLLRRMKRGGDAVSEALSDFFDDGSIRLVTKTWSLSATSPHIAVHATITPDELRSGLDGNVIHGGLGSRFLVSFAERTHNVPLPAPTDMTTVNAVAKAMQRILEYARGDYPQKQYSRAMAMSPEARDLYETAYLELRDRDPGGEIVTALLERRATITMRLAALFALSDSTAMIRWEHMEAALAWAAYHRDSVRYVLAQEADQHQRAGDLADRQTKVLAALRESGGWLSRTDIVRQVFRNHIRADDLTAVLESLLAAGSIEERTEPNANNPGEKTLYRIAGAKRSDTGTEAPA